MPEETSYDFVLKAGNESPAFQRQLLDEDDAPVDISGYQDVEFLMGPLDGDTLTVDSSMVVVDDDAGIVRYDWKPGETDTPGTYLGEIIVTYAGGADESFPNARDLYIRIDESLAGRR